MRLSEAIRLGGMMTTQARGVFSRTRRKYFGLFGPVVAETCALGAAYLAIGNRSKVVTASEDALAFRGVVKKGELTTEMETPREWSIVMGLVVMCPCRCGWMGGRVRELIPHLNDEHEWTREAIADWLEPLEARVCSATGSAPEAPALSVR